MQTSTKVLIGVGVAGAAWFGWGWWKRQQMVKQGIQQSLAPNNLLTMVPPSSGTANWMSNAIANCSGPPRSDGIIGQLFTPCNSTKPAYSPNNPQPTWGTADWGPQGFVPQNSGSNMNLINNLLSSVSPGALTLAMKGLGALLS